jgi:hypothetical protein
VSEVSGDSVSPWIKESRDREARDARIKIEESGGNVSEVSVD